MDGWMEQRVHYRLMHKYATIVQILYHLLTLTLHQTKHFAATCALWGLSPPSP